MAHGTDVIVVGAGLAGLVATAELAEAGHRVILVDQESEASLGGQAHWSFGGLFLVNSPEQRRLGIRDSPDLALQDWLGAAAFDHEGDHWGRRWAEAYVDFASGEKRAWLRAQGVSMFPLVQWAERGGQLATGHGNSVPRFHITWGTGPGLLRPFVNRVLAAEARGMVSLRFRHRVTGLTTTAGAVDGVTGQLLVPSPCDRGVPTSRAVAGGFAIRAQAVMITSGGIGGNHDLVRRCWPRRHGEAPQHLLSGVPDHVDGEMFDVCTAAGGRIVHVDRLWSYPEGIHSLAPAWTRHGIRILSGPSPLWLDARGRRLPAPLFPGFDTLGAVEHILGSGHEHSWFLLNHRIMGQEFALSGSEQNPDLTSRSLALLIRRLLPGAVAPVSELSRRCPDFIRATTVTGLALGMNDLTGEPLIDPVDLEREVIARDRQVESGLGKDAQVAAIVAARRYLPDRLVKVVRPHRLLDPKAGPLIAVRLSILTRKTLGGIETDLSGRVLEASGQPIPGLYAAGEAAGFGGGGMHGHRSLEGTFLGGCLFSGRVVGRAVATSLG